MARILRLQTIKLAQELWVAKGLENELNAVLTRVSILNHTIIALSWKF